jgi:hypothetical protein
MKKSTVKAAKSSTPAKKAPAKIVKKPAAAPAKRTVAPAVKAPAVKAPAVKASAAKAPAVKTPTARQPSTVITALINVGFGNALYLRGEGPGLSWDVGVALNCVADDKWSISLPGNGKPVIYKFLINDRTWSGGPDYITESGAEATVVPTF